MKQICTVLSICFCCTLPVSGINAQTNTTPTERSSYRTIYDMLRDVPGVEVKMNGTTGTITIRGVKSFNSTAQPLVVVNDIIYEGDLSNISPQDVDNITVLKDGAATAWGARAMFGVIQIRMKKGSDMGSATVHTYEGSAYKYFIDKQYKLKVFGKDDKVIMEGVIRREQNDSLVFVKKRKEVLIAIRDVKRVEVIPEEE